MRYVSFTNLANFARLAKLAKLADCYLTIMKSIIFASIKKALNDAPRNQYMAELHLQVLKYADQLEDITAKEFCESVELKPSYGTEFTKMRNLIPRLKKAGLKVDKI